MTEVSMTMTPEASSQRVTVVEQLPPVECAPWCKYGDGHPDEFFPEDQWCSSEVWTVTLTRMPLLGDFSERYLDRFNVYLAREREGRTHMRIELHDRDAGAMNIAEVRELRDNLTALLSVVDQNV